MSTINYYEPKILSFLCNWCSYAGADLAGVGRYQYPTNIRIIRVMCSGRIDPTLVLEAFINKIDGVMVLGCHPGDCHYITGNYYAEIRIKTLQTVLKIIGVKPERLLIDWVSASEGKRFANIVEKFTETITRIGSIQKDLPQQTLKNRLQAAKNALSKEKMRWIINREWDLLTNGNVFGETVDKDVFNEFKLNSLIKEYKKNLILSVLDESSLSVKEISLHTGIIPKEVLRNLILLERHNLITVSKIEGKSPKYRTLELK